MKRTDVRAALRELSAGKAQPRRSSTRIVNEAIVDKSQKDFVAWAIFTAPTNGEPITAPTELLTPLP